MSEQTQVVEYSRQELILDQDVARSANVNVIGAGTVGSNVAVGVGKLGIGNLSIWDHDAVEPHNLPSQRFGLLDLGRNKAEALADQIQAISDHANVTAYPDKFLGDSFLPDGVTIMAVDDMDARQSIMQSSILNFPNIPLVMDFRMGGNFLTVYAFNPTDQDKIRSYAGHNHSNEEAAEIPCGGRTVSYIGDMAGFIGANYVRLHLNDMKVPFITIVDASNGLVVQTFG